LKILHVNKFLYRRGGAEGYMLDLAAAQTDRGHEVEFFSMAHRENLPARFERSFPTQVDFDPPPDRLGARLKAVGRLMYSPAARRGMSDVLSAFGPDIAHVHNIYHQLSPSVLQPLRSRGVPTVMTMHDYKLACPTYLFLDHGQICEACLGGRFHQAILRRCNNGSLAASAVNAIEMTIHTAAKLYGAVDLFLCPSRFIAGKMAEAGVFPDRLRHVPLFIDPDPVAVKDAPGGGVVYAGRLRQEKGVDALLEAVTALPMEVHIAGDGPARGQLEAQARGLGRPDIRFHGHLPKDGLLELIRSASVLVLPSRCYENQPLAVLEAFACGVPVVGSDLGGIPELIEPGVDGELVPPDDPTALADALGRMTGDPDRAFAMGQAGRRKVLARYSPSAHLGRLDEIYAEAATLSRRKRQARPAVGRSAGS
jgi:glycosyltransferase involved in cell wall biosynthesis